MSLTMDQQLATLKADLAAQAAKITTLEAKTALATPEWDGVALAGINTGDTAWILTSTCLVLMMTIPGLALFYAGMSRANNALSTVMQSFAITCWVSILWLMFGYSLAFGHGGKDNRWVGGSNKFWLRGDDKTGTPVLPVQIQSSPGRPGTAAACASCAQSPRPLAHRSLVLSCSLYASCLVLPDDSTHTPCWRQGSRSGTMPEALFVIFQMTFAIITAAIITGAVAERMKFISLLVFVFFWHLLVYCPLCHWEWGGGFMSDWGVLDFAGGDVVHISSGVSGLVAAMIVGKRRAYGAGAELPPHNVMLTFIGGSLLWVGWFGFNAGSAVAANGTASMAMLVTHLAASAGGFSWMLMEWMVAGKPTVLGVVSGAIAGLVVITPGAGYVDQTGGFCMGVLGGIGCYFGIQIKHKLGYDDALDAFGVHGVGGIIGGILTGFFANPAISPGTSGVFYKNGDQLGWQLAGICVTAGYCSIMTAIILLCLKVTIGLRVSEEDEDIGLDASEHGHTTMPTTMPVPQPVQQQFVKQVEYYPPPDQPVAYSAYPMQPAFAAQTVFGPPQVPMQPIYQ